MIVDFITDELSWINLYLQDFINNLKKNNFIVRVFHDADSLQEGDFLFILSCSSLIKNEKLSLHRHNLVVHESDLPKGRGWSPLSWQVLEGCDKIPICLFECADKVDSGIIYFQDEITFLGHELVNELRAMQAKKTFDLCRAFIEQYPDILLKAKKQVGEPTYYRKRIKQDSQLDIKKSILSQFNLLRIVDNDVYPAFFEHMNKKYRIKIEKINDES